MHSKQLAAAVQTMFGQVPENVALVDHPPIGLNFFNLRAMLPREKRRLSMRENAKGVVSATHKHQRKHARRRTIRFALRVQNLRCAIEEPAGSKLLRRFARNAGIPKPDYQEARKWYAARTESREKVGHQGYHPRAKGTADAVRQAG